MSSSLTLRFDVGSSHDQDREMMDRVTCPASAGTIAG